MRRTITALLLTLALLGGVLTPVRAADTSSAKAQELYRMGLFKGKGTLPDGTPDFALEDLATRAEAATMLIRLLGKESKAEAQWAAGTLKCPFPDLDASGWAKANVTWLYENHYTNGTSAATYTPRQYVDLQQFCAFILRTLAYSEANGDFTWSGAVDFAQKIGLITAAQRTRYTARFDRGAMAEMCHTALGLTLRDSKRTLREKLTLDGVLTAQGTLVPANTALSGAAPITLSEKYQGGGADSKWYVQEAGVGAPLSLDLNGDGKKELLFSARSIFCLDGATGEILWKINSGKDRSTPWASGQDFGATALNMEVTDLDGDGALEIISVMRNYASQTSCVAVYDRNGYFKPGWPLVTTAVINALHIADLEGDGPKELCLGMGVGLDPVPALYVYESDGSLRPGWPQVETGSSVRGYGIYAAGSIGTADLDGDGKLEVLTIQDHSFICAFHADGTPYIATAGMYKGLQWNGVPICESIEYEATCVDWAHTWGHGMGYPDDDRILGNVRELRNCFSGTRGGLVIDDMDGDGKVELACVGMIADGALVMRGNDNTFEGCVYYFSPLILNADRTRYTNAAKGFDWTQIPAWQPDYITIDSLPNLPVTDHAPVVADVDGDGNKELLYSCNDGMVHCWHLDGTEHGAWPYDLDPRSSEVIAYASKPVCADLNGDGKLEIIFGSYTPSDQPERGHLYVLDCTGKVLADQPLPGRYAGEYPGFTNGCRAQVCVDDVDGDGKPEIAVVTLSCGLVVYDVG